MRGTRKRDERSGDLLLIRFIWWGVSHRRRFQINVSVLIIISVMDKGRDVRRVQSRFSPAKRQIKQSVHKLLYGEQMTNY